MLYICYPVHIDQPLNKTGPSVISVTTGSISRDGGRQRGATLLWPSSKCGWNHLKPEAPFCLLTSGAQRSVSSGTNEGQCSRCRETRPHRKCLLCFITYLNKHRYIKSVSCKLICLQYIFIYLQINDQLNLYDLVFFKTFLLPKQMVIFL